MESGYQKRLEEMEAWYRELVTLSEREELLLQDYEPHRGYLQSLRGSVIDIGGGAGVAARFLHADVTYVVVDPSHVWTSPEWIEFGERFRAGGPEPEFVMAAGEELPFADSAFDAAISYWALNHVADPKRCIREMARVLRRGGSARVVVDDIEPHWGDLFFDGSRRAAARITRTHYRAAISRPFREAIAMKLRGEWTIQDDHFPIANDDLLAWIKPAFEIVRRQWIEGSLTLDLVKK